MMRYKRKKTLKITFFFWVIQGPYHGSERPEMTKPFSIMKSIEDELVHEINPL